MRNESKGQDLSLLISNNAYYQEILQQLDTDKISKNCEMEEQIEQAFAVICKNHSPMVAIDFLDLCPIQLISKDLFNEIENGAYKAFSAHLNHLVRLTKLEIKAPFRNDQGNLSPSSIIAMTSDRVQKTPFKYLINSQLLQEWTRLITEKTPITPEFELIFEHLKKNSLNMAVYLGQCLQKEAWSKALYILKKMSFIDLEPDLSYLLPMITRNKESLFNYEILDERKNDNSDYLLTRDNLSDMMSPEPQTALGKIYSLLFPGRLIARMGVPLREAELKKTQERHELELKKIQEFRTLQAQYQKYSAKAESKIQEGIFASHECVDTVVELAILDSAGESRKSAKQMAQQFSQELKSWYTENKHNENHLIFIMLETLALLGEYGGERLPQKKHHPELKRIPIKVYFDSPKKHLDSSESFFVCGSYRNKYGAHAYLPDPYLNLRYPLASVVLHEQMHQINLFILPEKECQPKNSDLWLHLVESIQNDFSNYDNKHGELPALYTYLRWKSLIDGYSSEEWSKEAPSHFIQIFLETSALPDFPDPVFSIETIILFHKAALQLRGDLIDFRDQTRKQLNQIKDQGQLKRSEIADLFRRGKIQEGMRSLPPKHCSALNIYPLFWVKTPEERQQLIKAGYKEGDKFTQFLKREESIAPPSP